MASRHLPFLLLLCACSQGDPPSSPSEPWDALHAPPAPELTRTEKVAPVADSILEEWRFQTAGSVESRALLLRPLGDGPFPCAIVLRRAKHSLRQALDDARPLLDDGIAILVPELFSLQLPAAFLERHEVEAQLYRRERAVLGVAACFDLLEAEAWCDPNRRFLLGSSLGATLAIPASVREPRCRLLVAQVPTAWLPYGRLDAQVPPSRLEKVRAVAQQVVPMKLALHLAELDTFFVFAQQDEVVPAATASAYASKAGADSDLLVLETGHRFPFTLALESGLRDKLLACLAVPWEPLSEPILVPASTRDAMMGAGISADG